MRLENIVGFHCWELRSFLSTICCDVQLGGVGDSGEPGVTGFFFVLLPPPVAAVGNSFG